MFVLVNFQNSDIYI